MSDVMTVVGSLAAAAVDRLGSIDGRWLLLALAAQLAHLLLRSLAWRNAIAAAYPEQRVPYAGLGAAYLAGVALNSFAPARAGEAAKIALARMQVPRSSVATIAAAGVVVLVVDLAMTATLGTMAW